MRKSAWSLVLSMVLLLGVGFAGDTPEVKEEKDKISYSVGYQVGRDFKRQGVDLNPELLVRGVQDGMSGGKPLMTQQEMNETLVDLKKKVVAEEQRQKKEAAGKNLQEGKAFLAENAKKKDVTTLPSGLQYKVIEKGSGASPKKTDSVTVHYKGTLIDGTEFDSSYRRNEPATFPLRGLIRAWQLAVPMMGIGDTIEIAAPATLAYGPVGRGPIPGGATLLFRIELLDIPGQ